MGLLGGGGSDREALRGRGPAYDFAKISRKLHEIEKILGPKGGRLGCPLGSGTVILRL